jgi:hypothetical protein
MLEPFVDAFDTIAWRQLEAEFREQVARQIQNPVDVQRRSHVRLDLRRHSRHGQRDDVPRALVIQMHAGVLHRTHMHSR